MGIVSDKTNKTKGHRHGKAVALLEFVFVAILSGSIFYEYLHNAFLQDYVKNAIESNASILQFAVPVGFAAIAGSLLFQRRREASEARAALRREEIIRGLKFGDSVLPFAETLPHHQMVFERPARDSSFQIRKTRKKGRLSRIHQGEKLPPENSS